MKKNIIKLEQSLGFKINKFDLYQKAITHKSSDNINNYEKLEFQGYVFQKNYLKYFQMKKKAYQIKNWHHQ